VASRVGKEEGGGTGRGGNLLKLYTKFFGGKILLEHLLPTTHTIFSSKNSRMTPGLPENFPLRNEKY
jgi:hypothetical protein